MTDKEKIAAIVNENAIMSVTIEAKIVDAVMAGLSQHTGFTEWWTLTHSVSLHQTEILDSLCSRVENTIEDHIPPEKKQRQLAERVCWLFLNPRHGPSSHILHETLEEWRKLDGTWESQL